MIWRVRGDAPGTSCFLFAGKNASGGAICSHGPHHCGLVSSCKSAVHSTENCSLSSGYCAWRDIVTDETPTQCALQSNHCSCQGGLYMPASKLPPWTYQGPQFREDFIGPACGDQHLLFLVWWREWGTLRLLFPRQRGSRSHHPQVSRICDTALQADKFAVTETN